MKPNLFMKFNFYLLSMVLFFVIVAIIGTCIPVCFENGARFIGIGTCLTDKGIVIPLICVVALLYTGCFAYYLSHRIQGSKLGPIKICSIENVNNDILAFMGAYILPLVGFCSDAQWRNLVVLLLLFIVNGIIYARADIYYTNPTLLLLGYRVYKIKGKWGGKVIERIVISHGELQVDDLIHYIAIDDNTYYVRKDKEK